MIANKKTVNNDIGKHCELLVDDFFNFCDGKADEVKLIDIRDIDTPMPPELDQLRKMMARCSRAWLDYCNLAGLSMMSRKLFENRVKKKWQIKEQQMKQLQSRKRMQNATN